MKHPTVTTLRALLLAAATASLAACSPATPEMPAPMATSPATTSTTMPPATADAGVANVSDDEVTTRVKTALAQDATLKGFDIAVVTLKGDVRLTGMVDSASQISDAIEIARSAAGAHSIHDELTVKGATAEP